MLDKRKWVRMSEVAAAARVSTMTVSRVLRTPEKVRRETCERVAAAIRKLGYVPDAAAGTLSSRRSRIVGALVSTLGGSVFASTVDGLSQTLREAGYQLLLAATNYTPQLEADFIAAMLARRPDGLVLTSTQHTKAAHRLLTTAGIPIVELWELPDKPVGSAVGFSNRAAGKAMTEFLLDSGRQRIGFIGRAAPSDTRGQLRRAGYEDALLARALAAAARPASSRRRAWAATTRAPARLGSQNCWRAGRTPARCSAPATASPWVRCRRHDGAASTCPRTSPLPASATSKWPARTAWP